LHVLTVLIVFRPVVTWSRRSAGAARATVTSSKLISCFDRGFQTKV